MTASERLKIAMNQWMPWFIAFGLGLFLLGKVMAVGINASPSLPQKVFLVSKLEKTPQRGQLIAFKFYGEVYPHGTEFTKYVVGLPGDVVTEKDRVFYINGVPVGRAKEVGLSLEPLQMNGFRGVIPPGKFWYATTHVDSFDSRYALAGLGDMQDIVGRAYPLF
jgi:conjugal transfer pilin signal peptidase TrbI